MNKEPFFYDLEIYGEGFEEDRLLRIGGMEKEEYVRYLNEESNGECKTIAVVLDDGRIVYFDECGRTCSNTQQKIREALDILSNYVDPMTLPKNQVKKVKEEMLELLKSLKVHKKEITTEVDTMDLVDLYKMLGGREEDFEDSDLSKIKSKIENYMFYKYLISPVQVQYIYQEIPRNHLLAFTSEVDGIKFRHYYLEKNGRYVVTIQIL